MKIRNDVEVYLGNYLAEQQQLAAAIDDSYGQQWQTIIDLVASGGKRLRPILLVTAYGGFGGKEYQSAVSLAAAQEILHVALLIHDDIIDRQLVRRGQPNIAGRYTKTYGDAHLAMSAALLAGDLCISVAYQLLAAAQLKEPTQAEVFKLFGRAIHEVAGGQLIDMESAIRTYTTSDALRVAHYKTASYSFEGPLAIGAVAAGAGEHAVEQIRQFGQHTGLAFQLVDDLLGMYGEDEEIGKSSLADLREGKQTALITMARELAPSQEVTYLEQALGNADADRPMLSRVREILESSGARGKVEELVDEHGGQARNVLATIDMIDSAKERLGELLNQSTHRKS